MCSSPAARAQSPPLLTNFAAAPHPDGRYRLFSTFLIVPAGFLRVLASKQVHIDEDDINDSDSDNEDAQAGNQEANTLSRKVCLPIISNFIDQHTAQSGTTRVLRVAAEMHCDA